jgi:hypothetical protein
MKLIQQLKLVVPIFLLKTIFTLLMVITITSSNSAGYTTTTNFTAGINYLEIKNLNTRDRKIEAGTGTTTGSIRCE